MPHWRSLCPITICISHCVDCIARPHCASILCQRHLSFALQKCTMSQLDTNCKVCSLQCSYSHAWYKGLNKTLYINMPNVITEAHDIPCPTAVTKGSSKLWQCILYVPFKQVLKYSTIMKKSCAQLRWEDYSWYQWASQSKQLCATLLVYGISHGHGQLKTILVQLLWSVAIHIFKNLVNKLYSYLQKDWD